MLRTSDDDQQASRVPTLDELIGERKRLRGFSYADLENRVGGAITRQRWQQLGTGVRIKEFPEPATLKAMAKGLDVDVAEVVLAAARSIGLDVKRGAQSDLAARLPSTADRLSEVQRDAIVTLVRSITEVADDITKESTATARKGQAPQSQKNGAAGRRHLSKVPNLTVPEGGRDFDSDPIIQEPAAAYDPAGPTDAEQFNEGESPDPEGPEGGA